MGSVLLAGGASQDRRAARHIDILPMLRKTRACAANVGSRRFDSRSDKTSWWRQQTMTANLEAGIVLRGKKANRNPPTLADTPVSERPGRC